MSFPQVINANSSEAGEMSCYHCGLAGCEHWQQPSKETKNSSIKPLILGYQIFKSEIIRIPVFFCQNFLCWK